jgi:hypothetical protein
MKIFSICASLLFITSIAYGQQQTNLIGFQDIPWGSSVQTVRTKFPQLKAYDACKNVSGGENAARDAFEKKDMSCVSYSVEKYAVDGMNFNLTFRFTAENKLRDVSFDKYVEGDSSKSTPICKSTFLKLENFIKRKHGGGEVMPSDSDFYGFKALGFQFHEGELWKLGQSQVYLSNSWGFSKNPDLCWVNLAYSAGTQSPSDNGEEIKLQCRIQGTEQRSFGYLQKFDMVELVTYTKRTDGAQIIIGSSTGDGVVPPVATGLQLRNLVSATNKSTNNLISIENIMQDGNSKTTKYVTIDRNTGSINFYSHTQLPEGVGIIKGAGTCEKVNVNVRKF